MTLGKCAVTSLSRKQKIKVKISTEDEIIGAYDAVSQSLWTEYFLEDQGYNVEEKIMYQEKRGPFFGRRM